MTIGWEDAGMLVSLVSLVSDNAISLFVATLSLVAGWVVYKVIVAPWRSLVHYRKQGLKGPPFKPLVGNLQDVRKAYQGVSRKPIPIEEHGYVEAVVPHLWQWTERYAPGEQGLAFGRLTTTEVVLWEAELIREFFSKAWCYKRDFAVKKLLQVFTGGGLSALDTGEFWAEQRRILSAGFRIQFLKGLHHHVVAASNDLVHNWLQKIRGCNGSAEILVVQDVRAAALSIIARATYGADTEGGISLEAAAQVFQALDQRMIMSTMATRTLKFYVPALGFLLQTEADKRAAREDRLIDTLMEQLVDARLQAISSARGRQKNQVDGGNGESTNVAATGHDLLGIMIGAMLAGSKTMTKEQIVRECRNMFVAGHSTVTQVVTWALLLLAHHTDWQVKAREEVRRVTGNTGILDADAVNKLHIMGMIFYEVVRLYTPATLVTREAVVNHKLGHLNILAGTNVVVALTMLHRDAKYWDQPLKFKPERFEQGIGAACLNQADAYFPFGGGPRICIGQNLALLEAKVLIACILQRFSLQVSPRYQHAPIPSPVNAADQVLLLVKEL